VSWYSLPHLSAFGFAPLFFALTLALSLEFPVDFFFQSISVGSPCHAASQRRLPLTSCQETAFGFLTMPLSWSRLSVRSWQVAQSREVGAALRPHDR
jgi:hypothetical protein